MHFDPQGNPISKEEWERRKGEWLPSEADEAYVRSLMSKPVMEPKQMAHWLAPPPRGIKGRPVDFEYVRKNA
jgi:benzoyl-CoA 2,3-dioxygenase component B